MSRPHAVVMRRRAALGFLPGWLVLAGGSHAVAGSFRSALDFATRLTTQQHQEQAMKTTLTITANALAVERVVALAEHALRIDPTPDTAVEDRRAVDHVRDAANDAWLAR